MAKYTKPDAAGCQTLIELYTKIANDFGNAAHWTAKGDPERAEAFVRGAKRTQKKLETLLQVQ